MSAPEQNWITITVGSLKAAGHGKIMDLAATTATGDEDPVSEAIEGAIARVRRAVNTGNALDADPTKVPKSLKAVTIRIALYALMERIRTPLSDDQKETRKNDNSDLLRISDKGIPVEKPDNPAGSAEMQESSSIAAVNVPRRQTGRGRCSGL